MGWRSGHKLYVIPLHHKQVATGRDSTWFVVAGCCTAAMCTACDMVVEGVEPF
jgi:hypothetical protein